MWTPKTRRARIVWAILHRVAIYGGLLGLAAWWMLWIPGPIAVDPPRSLTTSELDLEVHLRHDVEHIAGEIGERNVSDRPHQLDQAAAFIEASFASAGYQPQSQWYNVGTTRCRNIEANLPGNAEVVIIGAHYDSVPGSPGADDNATGVAALLDLAKMFAATHPHRTLRFVAFTNEEPPYFWQEQMGSLVYAKKCRRQGDHVVAMLSIECVGFYSGAANSQRYPAGLGFLYPSTGNFVAFIGNVWSRTLVHRAIASFRRTAALPSIGAAVPNALPGAGWSDHWSFWQQGFPAIEVTDTAPYRNPYYHTDADLPAGVDYGRLTRLTVAMRAVITDLAQ